ncbi:MAG TPA: response regulator [Methylomirabilota bacterium]|nr:response regulator [Methylomirabilota bacterium]
MLATTPSLRSNARPASADPALIFVVDDEPMIGEVVSVILNLEGYRHRFFLNPKHALEAIERGEERPDLLLTDFVMPPFNGLELIERARHVLPGLRTILYSGNVGQDIINQCNVKPDAFLAKPFLPKALLELVAKTLEADVRP